MKHLRYFENLSDYEVAKDNLDLPNMAFVEENQKVYYAGESSNDEPDKPEVDYSKQYLTFETIEDSAFKLTQNACEYSLDEGETWVSLEAETNTPIVSAGNKIMFKCTNPSISTSYGSYGMGTFSSTSKFNIEGNIMSLLYGDDFVDKNDLTGKSYAFFNLFCGCTDLVDASNLILPATTLDWCCYYQMFYGCTSLTTVPELPATTLVYGCYSNMFKSCTSLATTPELPATTLTESCYSSMFKSCTSLVTAPELHATTLAKNCYYQMFYGCTSLVTAPELHATTLAEKCYQQMFDGCSKLNNIIMLATDISAWDCLNHWVDGVASTGTFVKHTDMTSLPSGTSGIPSGWTVEDYAEI